MDYVLISGFITMLLTEVAKRVPQVPLNPTHQNTVKSVVIGLNAVAIFLTHLANGTLAQMPIENLGLEVLLATILSFLAYKVLPFTRKEKTA